MNYLIFIILIIFTCLPTTFAFGEDYFCTDELRTGMFKDKEKWTTKEIKELIEIGRKQGYLTVSALNDLGF